MKDFFLILRKAKIWYSDFTFLQRKVEKQSNLPLRSKLWVQKEAILGSIFSDSKKSKKELKEEVHEFMLLEDMAHYIVFLKLQ